ncbi:MAG: SGNH/GDSL hydrolase family protein [Alphaproteobacteria bacterium]|nr:SGNH/GDSL hydrolase family protein [Alphaproteobacteria bacterium]
MRLPLATLLLGLASCVATLDLQPGCDTDCVVDTDGAGVDTDPAPPDTDPPADTDADTDPPADTDTAPPPPTASSCFDGAFLNPPQAGPEYDQFGPVVGRHCAGTHHQAIDGIERVVFLGDSVTMGTPPTQQAKYYRNQLAAALAREFGLRAPGLAWQAPDLLSTLSLKESGDFANCARFGARTDDLQRDGNMVELCFPESKRDKRTLVVMTMGGNDIAAITQAGLAGQATDEIWEEVRGFVGLQEDALRWLTEDPTRFPGGLFVVFANLHEFTDGTGDTSSCTLFAISDLLGIGGFGGSWQDPTALEDMVIWANEQYLRMAVETKTDMVFMLENFCGHGWRHDDPTAPCYRGPGTPRWLDLTCIHPNATGHTALTALFMSTILDCDWPTGCTSTP